MGSLQVRVHLVDGVAEPVLVQGHRFTVHHIGAGTASNPTLRLDMGLIDVVADKEHKVVISLCDVAMGQIEAVIPLLTGRNREPDRVRALHPAGCRASSAGGADLRTDTEPIEVVSPRTQALYVHMHAVGVLGPRLRFPAANDPAYPLVPGHLPLDGYVDRVQAAVWLERLRRQPGPDHHGVR